MQDNRSLKDSINQINGFKNYMGGDSGNLPMNQDAVNDMLNLARLCDRESVIQPEFFPYYDASGAQAEWEDEHWYIEVDSNGKGWDFMAIKERNYKNAVNCFCMDLNSAFQLAKIFLFFINNEKQS